MRGVGGPQVAQVARAVVGLPDDIILPTKQ